MVLGRDRSIGGWWRTIVWLSLLGLGLVGMSGARPAAQAQSQPTMGAANEYPYPHLHNLIWDPADANHVYATSPMGGWFSRDAGMSWQVLTPDTPNLHYGRALIDPASRTLYLYRWGDANLYRSNDFGATWPVQNPALVYDVALMPNQPNGLYALHGDLRLRRSLDGGATWRDLAQPLRRPREMTFAVRNDGGLFVVADRRMFFSADGGFSWKAQGQWPSDLRPRELIAAPDGTFYALIASDDQPSVSGKMLLRSRDGGATWQAAFGLTPRFAVMKLVADGTLWVGSDDGQVWRNSDAAQWTTAAGLRNLPLQLAYPTQLRNDIPYTPTITDISVGPQGVVLIGTIHGIYRAPNPDAAALLRARGLTPTGPLPSSPMPPSASGQFFPETGIRLDEPFLSEWQRHGGLGLLGFPRTAAFVERNLDTNRDELVVYFERGRLGQPLGGGEFRLARLTPPLLAERGLAFGPSAPRPRCRSFPETGQQLCEPFLSLWQQSGGSQFLGLPLSTPSGSEAQWFERGRLEQTEGTAFICLLGSEELQARGWIP